MLKEYKPYGAFMVDIVSDFNGTIIEPPTCEPENRRIALAVKDREVQAIKTGRIWRAGKLLGLLGTKREIERRLSEYNAGLRPLAEVYEPFNTGVLRGQEPLLVWDTLDSYARELVAERKVDKGLLRAFAEAKNRGSRIGFLSAAIGHLIGRTITYAGYPDLVGLVQNTDTAIGRVLLSPSVISPYNDMVANRMEITNGVDRFTLDVYGEKARKFEDEFLRRRGYRDKTTKYVGDTADDLPVAELLPRGNFVVSRYATDAFRQQAAKHYGAATPTKIDDLRLALRD